MKLTPEVDEPEICIRYVYYQILNEEIFTGSNIKEINPQKILELIQNLEGKLHRSDIIDLFI
jgi:hypothetical protein